MHATVKCPGCQASLRVPTDAAGSEYICPRCQGIVANPAQQVEPAPLAAAPRGTEIVVGSPGPLPLCPTCGKEVERKWRFCPHCDGPLLSTQSPGRDENNPGFRQPGANKTCLMGMLGTLGALAVIFYLNMIFAQQVTLGVILVLLLPLLSAAGLSTLIVYWPNPSRRERPNPFRVLFLTFSILGMLVVGGCSFFLVGWIFLFVYCLAGGRMHLLLP